MSRADDYTGRMAAPDQMPTPDQLDDAAVEALLTGRGVAPGLEPVAVLVQTLRESADRPVQPSATLAAQMAAGVFTGPPELYRAPAHKPQGRGLGAAARRGARACAHGLAAVPRKLGGASLVAKAAAVAVGTAVIGLGSAGFAGVLPNPVQDQFDTVVERVSPYEPTHREGEQPAPGGVQPGVESPEPDLQQQEPADRPGSTAGPTEAPGATPDPPGNQPTQDPDQQTPGPPGNQPTDHPGQGNGNRPDVPPGQQKKQGG